jgi:hypothetical protein
MTAIRYLCPFRSPDGETHEVIVTLSHREMVDVLRHRAHGCGAGEPGGPLERHYAWHRAEKKVPDNFVPLYLQDQRLVLH